METNLSNLESNLEEGDKVKHKKNIYMQLIQSLLRSLKKKHPRE